MFDLSARSLRSGFSLVEMLVAIAIVGILAALLMPAIQSTRGAARRVQCQNNLRQLGIAAHGFNDAHKHLPPGYLGRLPAGSEPNFRHQNVGMLAYLMPHLGLQMIADEIDIDLEAKSLPPGPVGGKARVPYWSHRAPETWAIAQANVSHFLCPSTDARAADGGVMRVMAPKDWPGTIVYLFDPGSTADSLGRNNYVGTSGFVGEAAYGESLKGVFGNRTQTTFAEIRDGTSNTTMMGEAVGGFYCLNGRRKYSFPWVGVGSMPTGGGLRKPDHCLATGWWQFSSEHQGVVQFTFADGSVRSLSDDIGLREYVLLTSKADGGQDVDGLLPE